MKESRSISTAANLLQQMYWANKLSGTLPDTTLFSDNARATGKTRAVRHFTFAVPGDVSDSVFKLSKNSHLSVYLVLVSALAVLLNRYLHADDLIVGSPVYDSDGGRGVADNLVPLRFTIRDDFNFKMHLADVKRTVVEAYSNGAFPFTSTFELPGSAELGTRFRLFDIVASLRNIHDESHLVRLENSLSISFAANARSISGEIFYDSSVTNQPAIGRFTNHFLNVLGCVIRDPDIKLSDVKVLSPEEERQLVVEFNDSAADLPVDKAVPELFEEQVRKTPDRIAAVSCDQSISYAELNLRANRLAHQLQSMGVGREALVALLARRSIGYLIALIGIFKAGGAYLPLDPSHPPRRIRQILDQSRAGLILATDEFMPAIGEALEAGLHDDRPKVASLNDVGSEGPVQNPRPAWEARSLSYVIYTSGSTGLPKGAMIEHAGMRNHLYAKVLDLNIDEADAVGQNAPQCFDVSVWQFLSVLLAGGRVHIADDEIARDISQLLAMLERERITILEIVPSQMRAMLDVIGSSGNSRPELSPLRWLIVNGELLPPDLCRRWLALYPNALLINAYGHTECSDDETHHAIEETPSPGVINVPVGRPLANLRLYVLDRSMRPVPAGVPGEAYVGGIGVGRGYLDDPARTAQVWVPDEFSNEPGGRLYKTGDLVRHLPGGTLEFVGRVDFQVKVRGFRIELGEIESALAQHAALREAAAIVREDEPGQQRVVAYVVSSKQPAPTTSELHAFLKERLPDYMVPSAFVTMDRLPLNQNGKVDRRALPPPDQSRPELNESFLSPRTTVEARVAEIWNQVLGVERVGVYDNFFELGGHSLLATQVISRVRDAFEVELPLAALFEFPTVEGLSLAVTQKQVEELNDEEIAQIINELHNLAADVGAPQRIKNVS